MNIEISMDSVKIEDQTVKRPEYISRMQWLDYWDGVKAVKKSYCKYCGMTTKLQ